MISPTTAVVGYIPPTQYDKPLQYTQLEDGILKRVDIYFLVLFPSVLAASNIAS